MNAPAEREIACKTGKMALRPGQHAQNFDEIVFCDSLNNCLPYNSCFGGGYADGMDVSTRQRAGAPEFDTKW